jgi:heptosyltransferase III
MRIFPRTSAISPKILVVRPDRIGDVILSTPVLSALKKTYPKAQITFMVQEFVAPLLREIPEVDNVFIYEPKGRHKGIGGFFRLMEELRAQRFEIAVVLQSQLKITAALYGVGIPNRLGPLSKIHSFLFFNRGTRQRRSLVEMHEADYNIQVLRKLGIRAQTQSLQSKVAVRPERIEWARNFLADRGWTPEMEAQSPLVIVNPGMGGSALNWPENHYIDLVRALHMAGNTVLVTGGAVESHLLERLKREIEVLLAIDATADKGPGVNATASERKVLFYDGKETVDGLEKVLPLDHLAALFSFASVVVAPSTGPLHIAVALGKPVVSFYPPIRVQSAIRWGPYHLSEADASVLVPEVYCGEDFKCRGSVCHYFPCMKTILPSQALEEVNRQLSRAAIRFNRDITEVNESLNANANEKN